jgi:hypothetical protein
MMNTLPTMKSDSEFRKPLQRLAPAINSDQERQDQADIAGFRSPDGHPAMS